MKYVYVIYDPLLEKVVCVHAKSNMKCSSCIKENDLYSNRRDLYPLQEIKKKIKE